MSIFVSVASYCDDLLVQTLRDCHAKAAHPIALHFGVVDQNDENVRDAIDALPFRNQIHYVHVNPLDARGAAWARHVAFSLYDDEDHLLQIDAHTVFEREWDRQLLEQLAEVQAIAPKPILTAYPPGFSMVDGVPVTRPWGRGTVFALRPDPSDRITLESPAVRHVGEQRRSSRAVPGTHIAAGFLFTLGTFVEDVPYDPFLYFTGEEHDLALRAFTRGWDIFHPPHVPLFHRYRADGESARGQHWNEVLDARRVHRWQAFDRRSAKRLRRLLFGRGLPGPYGLGSARSLEDFRRASGIDYRRLTVDPKHVERPIGLDAMRPPSPGPMRIGVLAIGTGRPDDTRRVLLEWIAQSLRPHVAVFVQNDGAPNLGNLLDDLRPAFDVHWIHRPAIVDARTAFADGLTRLVEQEVDVVVVAARDPHRATFVRAALEPLGDHDVAFGAPRTSVTLTRAEPTVTEVHEEGIACAGASFTRAFAEALIDVLRGRSEGSVDDAFAETVTRGFRVTRIGEATTIRVVDER